MTCKTAAIMFVFITTAVLAGCGTSPPTEFITLHTAAASGAIRPYSGPPIIVGRVMLPPELDRLSLVRRMGDNRLDVSGIVRWSAPLDLLVRRTLAIDLAHRLPFGKVIIPGEPPLSPHVHARVLVTTFERFYVGPSGTVHIQVLWSLVEASTSKVLFTRIITITSPAASPRGGDIAGAISKALGKLATKISAALANA